jgi:hypothetical protein
LPHSASTRKETHSDPNYVQNRLFGNTLDETLFY